MTSCLYFKVTEEEINKFIKKLQETGLRDLLHEWDNKPIDEQRWLPLEVMTVGYYLCDARNFELGYWNGKEFEYMRTKFGRTYPDTEEHWDRGAPHGTVKPIKYLGESYDG